MIKVIFFDFDGVIVESVDIKTKAFYRLFQNEGRDIAQKVVDHHLKNIGVSRYDKFRYIYREILKRPLTEGGFKRLCDTFASFVVDNIIKAPYVKGAREFLENHALEYKCFVVSATPQGEIEEIIHRRGIGGFFRGIYGAPNKKSDVVRNTLITTKINPADSLYVGDALSDYNAAKDNYVKFIARVNTDESIFDHVDCPKIRDLTNLIKIIETFDSYSFT